MSESDNESEYTDALVTVIKDVSYESRRITTLEERIIALERGLEGVLRRLEESGQPEDEAGWFGRPE